MKQYQQLLRDIQANGRRKTNRTGIDTVGIFGYQTRFELSQGFPILTTKKVHFKSVLHELLWFLKGSTNIKYLVDNDVRIWNEWAYKAYTNTRGLSTDELVEVVGPVKGFRFMTQGEFVAKIKADSAFAAKWGELGQGTYGGMWRKFPTPIMVEMVRDFSGKATCTGVEFVDQIRVLMEKLASNPDDRRLIVSAWHPGYVDTCALPPCHCLFQFNTEELTEEEQAQNGGKKRRLNCQLYQRSCDAFLGVPFNITSYSLLTCMVANMVDMVPGTFVHTFGDLHIYVNHFDQVKEQLAREPKPLPQLVIKTKPEKIWDYKYEDFELVGYDPHPPIKAEVAV